MGYMFLQQYHREMMEIQLDHSESEKQGDVPVFTPALGVEALHEYARKNQEELENLGTFLTYTLMLSMLGIIFSKKYFRTFFLFFFFSRK